VVHGNAIADAYRPHLKRSAAACANAGFYGIRNLS
jgi:hypothetical protein